jgi:hypothetical protein
MPNGAQDDDGRMGLPSGSFLPRLRLCLGSWQACKRVSKEEKQEIEDKHSDDAKEGHKRHDYIEQYIKDMTLPEDIDEAQEKTCRGVYRLLTQARKELGFIEADTEVMQETRLPLRNESLDKVSTGKFDYLELCKELSSCIIADWKTLFKEHEAPKSNYQLIQYACEVMQKYPWIQNFYLVLIQPNLVRDKQLQIALFTREELQYYLEDILEIYEDAKAEDAPRVAGVKQCEYCDARFTCQVRIASALALTQTPVLEQDGVDGEKLKEIRHAAKLLGDIAKRYEARAKKLLAEDKGSVKGWRLQKGRTNMKVPDTRAAWEVLSELFEPEDFSRCCKLEIGATADLLYEKLNTDTHKISKAQCKENIINAMLKRGILEVSRNAPSLAEE